MSTFSGSDLDMQRGSKYYFYGRTQQEAHADGVFKDPAEYLDIDDQFVIKPDYRASSVSA